MSNVVWKRRLRGYGTAFGIVILATVLKIFIAGHIAPLPPFILYFGAAILVAIYGGWGPGVVTVVLSAIGCWYFFLPPYNSFALKSTYLFQLIIFVVESFIMIRISASLKTATEKMTRSEKRFRSILEKSKEGMTLRNREGDLLYMSPATNRLLGYSFHQYRQVDPLTLVRMEEREMYISVYERVAKKPFSSQTITYKARTKKGWIWLEDSITNLLEDPAVGSIVSNFRNVSDRMELEERRNNFLNMASHELKTPLTSINVFSDVLQKRLLEIRDVQSLKYIKKIRGQLHNMVGLVQELLDVTRMQQGILKIEKQKFFVKELAQEIVEDLQMTTENTLQMHWQTKLPIYADRERIRQVITNLITNAIKYSPKGKKILIRSQKKDNDIIISVQDFGIGIPPTEQKRIFERFYQVKNHSTYPGLGLGLFISMQILKQHRGKIWVESREGKGSTFSFSLPVDRAN